MANTISKSPTIHLPVWWDILTQLGMKITMMQHDVSTRWNSTWDMLEYALEHREAIDQMTQRREGGMRKFELSDVEWLILDQLR